MSTCDSFGARRALVALVLATGWVGGAHAQGRVLELPMQPIKKHVAPCAACADSAGQSLGEEVLRSQDRAGPEFPAAQGDLVVNNGSPADAPLVDLPGVDRLGAGDPGTGTSSPATLPAR